MTRVLSAITRTVSKAVYQRAGSNSEGCEAEQPNTLGCLLAGHRAKRGRTSTRASVVNSKDPAHRCSSVLEARAFGGISCMDTHRIREALAVKLRAHLRGLNLHLCSFRSWNGAAATAKSPSALQTGGGLSFKWAKQQVIDFLQCLSSRGPRRLGM